MGTFVALLLCGFGFLAGFGAFFFAGLLLLACSSASPFSGCALLEFELATSLQAGAYPIYSKRQKKFALKIVVISFNN